MENRHSVTTGSQEHLRLSNEETNRLTRECLQTAMLKLIGQKRLEEISITELSRQAGVSRVAFYRNYESKEAVVEDLCKSLYLELEKSVSSKRYKADRRQWYIDFFRTIKEHKNYFHIYQEAHLSFGEAQVLDKVFPPQSTLDHYRNAAATGAFLQILMEWFKDGMKETPEEMAEICRQILCS